MLAGQTPGKEEQTVQLDVYVFVVTCLHWSKHVRAPPTTSRAFSGSDDDVRLRVWQRNAWMCDRTPRRYNGFVASSRVQTPNVPQGNKFRTKLQFVIGAIDDESCMMRLTQDMEYVAARRNAAAGVCA